MPVPSSSQGTAPGTPTVTSGAQTVYGYTGQVVGAPAPVAQVAAKVAAAVGAAPAPPPPPAPKPVVTPPPTPGLPVFITDPVSGISFNTQTGQYFSPTGQVLSTLPAGVVIPAWSGSPGGGTGIGSQTLAEAQKIVAATPITTLQPTKPDAPVVKTPTTGKDSYIVDVPLKEGGYRQSVMTEATILAAGGVIPLQAKYESKVHADIMSGIPESVARLYALAIIWLKLFLRNWG